MARTLKEKVFTDSDILEEAFCPRSQQHPFVIWKQHVENCAHSFALPGSIVQSPKEQKKWVCRHTVEGNYPRLNFHGEPQIAQDCASSLIEVAFHEVPSMGTSEICRLGQQTEVNSRAVVETQAAKGIQRLGDRQQHLSRKSLLLRFWNRSLKEVTRMPGKGRKHPNWNKERQKKKTSWSLISDYR